jgi:nucleoside-diphosphate-sugar epimerase
MKKRIAILGATGQIAKGLLFSWARGGDLTLHVFARSQERLALFLKEHQLTERVQAHPFQEFSQGDYTAVVNCVGIGSPARLAEHPGEIFSLTAEFDDLCLAYLKAHPQTQYLHFSSGAVYGTDFASPAGDGACNPVPVNQLTAAHFYGLAKIHAEAKHRALPELGIVDLRVFGYFSRFADLTQKYFINDILGSIRGKKTLVTGAGDFSRDFAHFRDLAAILEKCLAQPRLNAALDVYSRKPATKFELLDFFRGVHGLNYRVDENIETVSPTGSKTQYFSLSRKAGQVLGYAPALTSLDCLREEAACLLPPRT